MNTEVPLKDIEQKASVIASEHFRKGLNCAESVYKAIQDVGLVEFPPETVALATAFGGGIGLYGGVCGALAGLTMAVSAVHGRKQPWAEEHQDIIDQLYGNPGLYRFFNQIPEQFQKKFGSTTCQELISDYQEWFDNQRFCQCRYIVMESTIMAVQFITQGNEEGYCQAFGRNMAGKE
ncbi:hypothetical protein ASZ90_019121 [hydrocarbon metagenome]|uniref:C_GCAxxG_C_C family protein n=1 Tax=hydrocarbon metagenome TaxID=938273 RepID=A0A0W8E4X0_9ZZZZ